MARCRIHKSVTLRCPACTGAKGGAAKSERKTEAARANARKPRLAAKPRPTDRQGERP